MAVVKIELQTEIGRANRRYDVGGLLCVGQEVIRHVDGVDRFDQDIDAGWRGPPRGFLKIALEHIARCPVRNEP